MATTGGRGGACRAGFGSRPCGRAEGAALDRRRFLDDRLPVEREIGMRVFQSRARFIVERAPSNGEVRRRSKQVQHARVAARRRPTAAVHHVRGFVALLVARISQERHGDLRCGSLPASRGGRRGLSAPGRRLSRRRRRLADRLCRRARFRGRRLGWRGLDLREFARSGFGGRRFLRDGARGHRRRLGLHAGGGAGVGDAAFTGTGGGATGGGGGGAGLGGIVASVAIGPRTRVADASREIRTRSKPSAAGRYVQTSLTCA